ncbi:MAG TPA: alpha-2-macroglobulin [Xanthomonadaceae bacterium]
MDLLHFLLKLPMRLLRALWFVIGWLWRIIERTLAKLLRPVVGDVSWLAPEWMLAVKREPRKYAQIFASAAIVLAGGWYGWHWWKNRPHPPEPVRITWQVHAPSTTDYTKQPIIIDTLQVNFSASVAPIEAVGKPVTKGITVQPEVKGQWTWVDDKTLRFVPAADWPVGQKYAVSFNVSQAFAPHVLLADDHFDFAIEPFKATLGKGEFYQDPTDATAKKIIQEVDFNYPIDTARFEKAIALAVVNPDAQKGPPLLFTVTYDPFKLKAWVHSQQLPLPHDDGAIAVTIDKGLCSSRGGDCTDQPLQTSVRVPGLYSLAIDDISPTLVDNDRYEPEQVMVVNVRGAVRDSELAGLVHAWVLPARKSGADVAKVKPPSASSDDDDEDDTSDSDQAPYEWSAAEVDEAVLARAQKLKLAVVPTENEFQEMQSFKFRANPGQRIYVRVDQGLKSFGGYILGKPRVELFTVPDYPKLLRFVADGSLLSLSGSKRISVVSRNMPGMDLVVGRVLPDQLQHLVSLNQGNYSHPQLPSDFSEEHIIERFELKRAFAKDDPSHAHYEGVDLSDYLKEGRRGVFLLHLSGYDQKAEKKAEAAKAKAKKLADEGMTAQPSDSDSDENGDGDSASEDSGSEGDEGGDSGDGSQASDNRLIVVTDLGMLVKKSLDGSQDVFVQSIHAGDPVGDASVSVLAINGQTLFTQNTSADGVVHFPSLKGLDHEKKPAMYLVTKGQDMSFLPIGGSDRQLDYSRFDIGGDASATNEGQLSGYLFSDRGIYRPGDEFHIGLIVRAASWTHSVAGVPLQAEIVDPRGMTMKQVPLTMDASGFGELSYTTAETSPTGTWTVNLYIARDGKLGNQIGSTTVTVKEFLPDRMKVSAKLSSQVIEGWVKPAGLKGLVDAQNLFGTPAANRRVEASLTLRPAYPAFRSWPDYHFYDIRRAKEGFEETLQDGKTDDSGHAEFDLHLQKYAEATYQLFFLAKAHEAEGGRSVAAAAQSMVSDNDWLIGYKAVDDLSYVTRGAKRGVHLVAINPEARAIALDGLKARLIERKYVSVLTKQDSGVYKYESKLKEIPVGDKPLAIPAAGLDYALPTDKPGDWALLVVRAGDDKEVNRVSWTVAGAANVSRSLDRNAELQLNLDKHDYKPGDAVQIAIHAPYTGSGLITIERDKVYAHAWFKATTTSSVQKITVPKDFEGNGYINVQFVRDPSSDEVFMSPLSYGVVPFSVNVDGRRNALTVDAPALVKPGETATFRLHAAQPTRAVLFVVDEGILQVARYKLGDPLQFFFRKRMLEVKTAQILDLILPDFEKLSALTAAPGGDADAAIMKQLNPFKRKRDKPVVYWSGIVDVNGQKDFSYAVPDYFNGKLRVMAVAVSADRIGTVENATTVRGDFVLSPNVPTTLAPGDEAEVSVGVANNIAGLAAAVPVQVTLKTGPQLQVVGSATQGVTLASMREGVVMFRVKATDTLGSGNLTFTAGAAGKSARQSVDLSVRPASPYRTQVDVGRVDAGKQIDEPNLRAMYDAYASRDAAFSTLPIVLAQGLTSYLVNYENYCSEQIVSSTIPQLVVSKWPVVPVFAHALKPAHGGGSSDKAIADALDTLRLRQNSAGGFGLWSATPDAEPFASAYAMHFLVEAHERGTRVPNGMLDAGNKYLLELASSDEGAATLDSLRQRAYAVYLLTRQGQVTTNNLAAVQKRLQEIAPNSWKNDLAAAWLASSYKLLKQDKEANALMNGPANELARSAADEPFVHGYYYDPLTRDATVLYLLSKHFPERAKALPPRVFENLAWPLAHDEFNTTSAAMTILALDSYATQTAADVAKLQIAEVRADRSMKQIGAQQGNLLQAASWNAAVTKLRFVNLSTISAWHVATQGGYDRTAPKEAIRNGIEIARDYTDANGKPLTQVTVGQEIDVHVRIRATGAQGVGNVAIVDLLPGGFEPVITPAPEPDAASGASDQSDGGDASSPADDSAQSSSWRSRIGVSGSTWQPDYADIREDRVVIYGTATPDVREFVYRIKATNAGSFIGPPAYGEGMYDRTIQARSLGGGTLTVVKPQ